MANMFLVAPKSQLWLNYYFFSLQTTQISFIHIPTIYKYIELLHKIVWKSSITFSLNAAIVGHKSQKSNSTMISWNIFFLLQIICEFEIYIHIILYIRYATHIKETNWYNMYISMKIFLQSIFFVMHISLLQVTNIIQLIDANLL